jgi:hypothetical protein
VERDNSVIVDYPIANGYGGTNLVLGEDGRLRYANGGPYVPGMLIYGRYIEIDGLLLLEGMGARASRGQGVYITESQFDAQTGTLVVQGEGAPDAFRALTVRQG